MRETIPLLFDTQAVISWAMGAPPQTIISRVKTGVPVYVSVVSFWEFLLKSRYHGIGTTFAEMRAVVHALRATILGIELPHLETLEKLPVVGNHRDPFDRLIISQAISESCVLVGKDRLFPRYSKTSVGRDLTVLWG